MKRWWFVAVLAVGLSVAAVNAQFSNNFSDDFLNSPAGEAFMQSYGALKSNYLDQVDDDTVIQGAIEGMLNSLEDPYTSYADPSQTARRNEDMAGSFEGIGAVLQPRNREERTTVEIINVYRGGPAWNAGVQRGDIFAEVDGESVEDATIDDIVGKVRGPRGTEVELGMRRPGSDDLVRFTIERDTIQIVDVDSTMLPNNVGYVSIRSFGNQRVYDQLTEQLVKLKEQGATSLVLDLRDNPGGLLTQGILVSDEFLTEGDIVFQRARGVTQRLATADEAAFDLPMVVIINKNSASASEIVAGALQDNGRALVVGEESFGKGVGQSVLPLSNGGQLTYLSFEWLTPDRRSINKEGIKPDIEAEDTRFPNVISVQGQGAEPGQEVEVSVGGKAVGTATADEEGNFSFYEAQARPEQSDTQGQALVNLDTDNALMVAYQTVLGLDEEEPTTASKTQ